MAQSDPQMKNDDIAGIAAQERPYLRSSAQFAARL